MKPVAFAQLVSLITDKTSSRDNQVGLEMIEGQTGRRLPSEATYDGDGVAFQRGDVLFGKLRLYLAKAWLADASGSAVGDFHVLRPKPEVANSRFVNYFALSDAFLNEVSAAVQGAKMPRANWDVVRSVRLNVLDLPTQKAIADYLDRETAQIDTLIAKQEQLIATLRERRRSGIDVTVSELTDVQRPVRTLATLVNGFPFDAASFGDAGVPLVRIRDLFGSAFETFVPSESVPPDSVIRKGDVIVGMDGDFNAVLWTREDAALNQRLCALKTNGSCDSAFLAYTLPARLREINVLTYATTVKHLSSKQIASIRIPLPPLDEQHRIVAHLDEQTSKIDNLISKAEQFIALSRERRAALITAAVTGQLDVTERAA